MTIFATDSVSISVATLPSFPTYGILVTLSETRFTAVFVIYSTVNLVFFNFSVVTLVSVTAVEKTVWQL